MGIQRRVSRLASAALGPIAKSGITAVFLTTWLGMAHAKPEEASKPPIVQMPPPALTARAEINLEGEWEYAFAPEVTDVPAADLTWSTTPVPMFHRRPKGVTVMWHRRRLDIPASWKGRRVHLVMEGNAKWTTVYLLSLIHI